MFNFQEIANLALSKGASIQIMQSEELAGVVTKLLGDPVLTDDCGSKGKELVADNQGALERVKRMIEKRIGSNSPTKPNEITQNSE